MRIVTLLLYLVTLIPAADMCASGECYLTESETHHLVELNSHESCSHHEHECEYGGHHHSQEECHSRSLLITRSDRESLRRAPVSVAASGFLLLFSRGPLRAPPVIFSELHQRSTTLNLRVVTSTVIRC